MKAFGLTLIAAFISCACSSTPPPQVDRNVPFTCTNGESISVVFSRANGTATLLRNGEHIQLKQQPSGSGFMYSNGPNTIRGKGDDLTVEIGRMVPLQCRAK